ncbi:MAG: hypothetical protein JJE04_16490 [Acidobacteriia bacterium]|nr:hypothetical protein [Terriglobia bacterium]
MSLSRRIDLTKRVRELGLRYECLAAGDKASDQIEAALLTQEIDRLYLQWGLVSIEGLMIDGSPATPAAVIEAGPESLCKEILAAIRAECQLSEEERKN